MKKLAKIVASVIYFVGTAIVLVLGVICLFGPRTEIFPDAMVPLTWREQAFVYLAIGTLPMLLACVFFFISKFNAIKNGRRKLVKSAAIFLPGAICLGCLLYIIGLLFWGYLFS